MWPGLSIAVQQSWGGESFTIRTTALDNRVEPHYLIAPIIAVVVGLFDNAQFKTRSETSKAREWNARSFREHTMYEYVILFLITAIGGLAALLLYNALQWGRCKAQELTLSGLTDGVRSLVWTFCRWFRKIALTAWVFTEEHPARWIRRFLRRELRHYRRRTKSRLAKISEAEN